MITTVDSVVLLQRLGESRNETAWKSFSARYEPMLVAFARKSGLCDFDAQDVIQETLMAFLTDFQSGKYDPSRGRPRAWLRGIALNRIRRFWCRPARRELQVVDETGATGFIERIPDKQLEDIFEAEWRRAVAAEALRELQRQVDEQTFNAFRLYAMENLSADNVASQLGVSKNVVYISKNRCLARLRDIQQQLDETW